MATDGVSQNHPEADEAVRSARDVAVSSVLQRHGLNGKRFHNEAVLLEVADAVALAVAEAVRGRSS